MPANTPYTQTNVHTSSATARVRDLYRRYSHSVIEEFGVLMGLRPTNGNEPMSSCFSELRPVPFSGKRAIPQPLRPLDR
jgi:hypothetical protein